MKCTKCNEREAVFHYSMNVNGKASETHLCHECAEAEGYGDMFNHNPMGMFEDMFAPRFGGFFDDFFAPRRSFFPSIGRLMAPIMSLPKISIVIGDNEAAQETPAETAEAKIPEDAGEEVKQRRELGELKSQLEQAVKAEDFEKAIELRDKIRELEK